MNNFNFSVLEGNVKDIPVSVNKGADNEISIFNIISHRSFTNKLGKRVEDNTEMLITVRGKLARNCNKCLKRGSRVLVSGKLVVDEAGFPQIEGKEVNFLSSPA